MSQTDLSKPKFYKEKENAESPSNDTMTKDDKLDKVFWFKLGFSLIMGCAFGFMNFTGFLSFAM